MLMTRSENIYLIGLMGAGKTTIGRQLAKSLTVPFYDSDKAIEESTGVDIPTIFEFEGEEGFRDREQKMIQQLTKLDGIEIKSVSSYSFSSFFIIFLSILKSNPNFLYSFCNKSF